MKKAFTVEDIADLEIKKRVILDEIKNKMGRNKDYGEYFRIQSKIKYHTRKLQTPPVDIPKSKVEKYKSLLEDLIANGGEDIDKTNEYKNLLFKIKYNESEILREYHSKHNRLNNIINKSVDGLCC